MILPTSFEINYKRTKNQPYITTQAYQYFQISKLIIINTYIAQILIKTHDYPTSNKTSNYLTQKEEIIKRHKSVYMSFIIVKTFESTYIDIVLFKPKI